MGAYVWVAAGGQGNVKFGEVLPGVVAAVVPNAKAVLMDLKFSVNASASLRWRNSTQSPQQWMLE